MKAINTLYKGNYFRSRTEARWAVYFDALGVRWEYEKEGYDLGDGIYYLPDFWFPDDNMYGEVKGSYPISSKDMYKMTKLCKQSQLTVCLFVGIPSTALATNFSIIDGKFVFRPAEFCLDAPFKRLFTGDDKEGGMFWHASQDSANEDPFRSAIYAAQTARFEHRNK